MREFPLNLSDALRHGIRPKPETAKNATVMEDVFGLVVTEFGLHAPEPTSDLYVGTEDETYTVDLFEGHWNPGFLEAMWTADSSNWTILYDYFQNGATPGDVRCTSYVDIPAGDYQLQWEVNLSAAIHLNIKIIDDEDQVIRTIEHNMDEGDGQWHSFTTSLNIPTTDSYTIAFEWLNPYEIVADGLAKVRDPRIYSVSVVPGVRPHQRSQVFFGTLHNILLIPQGYLTGGFYPTVLIKYINEANLELVDLDFYDAETDTEIKGVEYNGTYFDFVDFENAWFLNCTRSFGFKTPLSDHLLLTTNFYANSVCSWKNRLVLGGLHGDTLASVPFLAAFNEAVSMAHPDSALLEDSTPGEDTLMWTTVRGGDMFRSFEPELALLGVPSVPDPEMVLAYENLLRSGEIGFWKLPGVGEIVAVRELGDNLIVFGDRSIYLLNLVAGEDRLNVVGQRISSFGVLAGRAVSGGETALIAPDTSGRAWRFTPNAAPELLGYREIYLDNGVNLAFYDKRTDTHYLTDGLLQQWQLTPYGMSRTRNVVLGLLWRNATLCALQLPLTTGPPEEAAEPGIGFEYRFRTGVIDFGNQQLKTVRSVQVSGANADYWQAKIYVRESMGGDWMNSGWIQATEEGVVMDGVTGLEFKVEVRGVSSYERSDVRVDSLWVRWQQSDKRFVRGAYATQAGTVPG